MRKFWRFFLYFLRAQKCWRWPRESEVLIYDAAGQNILLEYLQSWKPEVLHVRGEQINVRVLFASLFNRGKKSDAYVDCFIKKVRPRLIVTYIDNNFGFYLLARKHQNAKTLFMQNGIRSYYADIFETLGCSKPSEDDVKVDYMLTFGRRIGAEYARYISGNVVPIGSLKNNLVPKRHTKKADTIAFISQYRDTKGLSMGDKFYSFEAFFEQADRLVLLFLAKYAKKNGKELFIVPCSGHDNGNDLKEKEQEYYRQILGQACIFSEMRWHGNSYDSIDTAEVVVSIDSTLGYESAARGNKTAMFAIRTQLLGVVALNYGWPGVYPDDGPFWTNCPDPVVFERILDHLFAVTEEQWRAELVEQGFADIMAYDPGNTVLQSVLRAELGEPSRDLALTEMSHNPSQAITRLHI
jgi:surface carbohydrate biosynthesis protein